MRKKQVRLAYEKELARKAKRDKAAKSAVVAKTVKAPVEPKVTVGSDGLVSLEVVGPAVGETVAAGRRRTLGGVSTTTLRRTVIDQMIREGGWVENDFHRNINGKNVYVVVAKSPDKSNRTQSRTFYFTESGGRIYRVSTRAPEESTEEAARRSEEMIRSLNSNKQTQQARKQ